MNMAQILMFADVPSAYEELACAARALGGEPVARYAGPSRETYDQVGVPAGYEIHNSAAMDKILTMGDLEYDNQLRKALEIASTAVKTETANAQANG